MIDENGLRSEIKTLRLRVQSLELMLAAAEGLQQPACESMSVFDLAYKLYSRDIIAYRKLGFVLTTCAQAVESGAVLDDAIYGGVPRADGVHVKPPAWQAPQEG